MKRVAVALALAALSIAPLGCGSDAAPGPAPVELKTETSDKLPKLDRGYEAFTNREAGITFGRPPGWKAEADGAVTELTAPDKLIAASISIDRTNEALASSPKAFATETAELLSGYREPLEPSRAKKFQHPYEGAVVEAKGTAEKSGVRQVVRVIVLERKGVGVVTAVIAENADKEVTAEAEQALEAIGTLRTQPPG